MRARLEADQTAMEASQSNGGSPKKMDKRLSVIKDKVVSIFNMMTDYEDPSIAKPLKRLKLGRGSYFGEDGQPNKNTTNKGPPVCGYLEIHNKSNEVFAVKIVYSGKGIKFEIPRPTYLAVPPRETVHAFFNPDFDALEIFLLFNTPHPVPD
eukprot:gene28516-35387_t